MILKNPLKIKMNEIENFGMGREDREEWKKYGGKNDLARGYMREVESWRCRVLWREEYFPANMSLFAGDFMGF